jgi:hypothetical protein
MFGVVRHKAAHGALAVVLPPLLALTACASSHPLVKSQSRTPGTTTQRAAGSSLPRPSSPTGVVASIVAATVAQKSVHVTETYSADLVGTATYTIDATRDSASERVEYDGTTHIRLVNGTVYLQGAARSLAFCLPNACLGLTKAQARHYAGRWISIAKGDKLYHRLAHGLTLASIAHDLTAEQGFHLKVLRKKSHGRRLLEVRGTTRRDTVGAYELKARATGTPLPLAFSVDPVGALMVFDRGRFSTWNEPVQVTAPKDAVPIATVRRS